MVNEKLIIEGMNCNHCVMGLKKELTDAGVTFTNVGIGYAEVSVDEQQFSDESLKSIVAEAGYTLVSIEKQ